MRKFLCAGNWKMYLGPLAAKHFGDELRTALLEKGEMERAVREGAMELALMPPFVSITSLRQALGDLPVALGAQNCHGEVQGAFTGEISAPMLSEVGCDYVIIGHSERRHVFGEQDDVMAKKIRAVLTEGMTPVFCVGELFLERDKGETLSVLERQMGAVLPHVTAQEMSTRLVVAYEPVWAIGTGKVASENDAQEACRYLRGLVAAAGGVEAGDQVRVLYGGSVKPENASGLARQADIDGFLVGGASLKPESFLGIARAALA